MTKSKKKRKIFNIIKVLLVSIVLLIAVYLAYIWFSYERIADNEYMETQIAGAYSYFQDNEPIIPGRAYNFMTYNIGFGAYTDDYSFFMDGGKYSWAISDEALMANICEITNVMNYSGADFMLLQEVDIDGTRTYHLNELDLINEFIKGYYYNYTLCYDSKFLLYPVWQPHGANKSAMVTYSKSPITSGLRRSLPVSKDFSKLFDLDRCYTVSRIPTYNEHELVLYNVHLSAYTDDVELKNAQVDMLLNDMENEYLDGNYVICGGDFNMNLKGDTEDSEYSWATGFPEERLPKGFIMGIEYAREGDVDHDSCRNADAPYDPEKSYTVTTDGFIVSDNIKVNFYINSNWNYACSDHDPVMMQVIFTE